MAVITECNGVKKMMQGTLGQNCLKIGALFTFVSVMPHAALALPKQGTGKCSCTCVAPSGVAPGGQLVSDNTYSAQGYSCGAFTGKTCNIDNPYTGGVATGEIIGCSDVKSSGQRVIIFSPFNGVQLAPSKRSFKK